ncbi:ABC-2 type transport system ATP-binding protein [Murinocardiopsis flavida]|uniref:ABC-2 type transport system ATP-binding protein n=1 Tax=Murinocardiopsis flavida TaxID=645275 RepID=A0A2P8DSM8_9ACTN|nr:ATP-binding cassette domain-containing protein [Murinocardiopsis flavida]PSL00229.1 ABC-2 type transport system ATP-binding protein [Murinocardiopsis flavida]
MPSALRVSALTKHFGSAAALQGVDLDVAEGEVYGLLGPNGAGKTTLMKAVAGLLRPDSGTLEVAGRPFTRDSLRGIGALVDGPGLWSGMSAREHVRAHARLRGVDPDDAVARLLPLVGMDQVADRRVSAYSLGMRWRLGIAIAMIGNPRLLVLDEPTNGLDPIGMREMRALMRRIAESGATVFVSSHQLDQIARTCDRVGVLVHGHTRYEGPLSGLARDGDLEEGFFALVERTSSGVR